jgi:hypothetical protein
MPTNPTRELLETIVPADWDSQKPSANSGFQRTRWLQGVNDLVKRPVVNRALVIAPDPAVNTTGSPVSTGIGTPNPLQPKRYAEFTVKARVTYNINATVPAYLYAYRTVGAVPANGAPPNAGDVIVGGDAFAGGATPGSGVNQIGTFSYLDTGLSVNLKYTYYLAVSAASGHVVNIINSSQILVMERS